jgi:hypothetical protein
MQRGHLLQRHAFHESKDEHASFIGIEPVHQLIKGAQRRAGELGRLPGVDWPAQRPYPSSSPYVELHISRRLRPRRDGCDREPLPSAPVSTDCASDDHASARVSTSLTMAVRPELGPARTRRSPSIPSRILSCGLSPSGNHSRPIAAQPCRYAAATDSRSPSAPYCAILRHSAPYCAIEPDREAPRRIITDRAAYSHDTIDVSHQRRDLLVTVAGAQGDQLDRLTRGPEYARKCVHETNWGRPSAA